VNEFVKNNVFSPRAARFVLLEEGAPLFSNFSKVHEFVQKSVFSPRLARIVIFAVRPQLFSDFEQSATKQSFQPDISTFCHSCTGNTTL